MLELQEALASSPRAAPVIFLTAHGDLPPSVRAMDFGACALAATSVIEPA